MTSSFSSQAEAFLSWWGQELQSLVPRDLMAAVSKKRPVVLRSNREGDYFLQPDGGATPPVEGDASAIAAALAKAGAGNEVVLRLGAADFLVVSLDLPNSAVGRARDILSLEIESSTPFSSNEATFDYLVDAKATGGIRRVKTFVAKNAVLEKSVNDLAAAGVSVAKADVEGAEGINLLARRLRRKRRVPIRRDVALVLASILLLAAGAYHRQDLAIRDHEAKKASLLSKTEGVRSAAAEANAASANIESLGKLIAANPPAIFVLSALTTALGDDVFLSEIRVAGLDVAISGAAASASDALAGIEASPAFVDAAFSSTVFTSQDREDETFSAKFRIEPDAFGAGGLNTK